MCSNPESSARAESSARSGSPLSRADFSAQFVAVRPGLVHYAQRLVHADDAEDVVSNTYCLALSLLERYDPDTGQPGLLRWLLSLLTNLCRECNFHAIQRNEELMPPAELEAAIDDTTDTNSLNTVNTETDAEDLDAWCEEEEAERRLHLRIKALCLNERRLEIWYKYSRGMTQREIGAQIGMSQQGVSYHLGVILTQLRASRGDLIGPDDGYRSTRKMWEDVCKATRYFRPARRGAHQGRMALKRLR